MFSCFFVLPSLFLVAIASSASSIDVAIAAHRLNYAEDMLPSLTKEDLVEMLNNNKASTIIFGRFQSPQSIMQRFSHCRHHHHDRAFQTYRGKDGRHGTYCTTQLGDDWILAESQQVANACTPQDVLVAYLSGRLQTKWNADTLLDCTISVRNRNRNNKHEKKPEKTTLLLHRWINSSNSKRRRNSSVSSNDDDEPYYQQDLVLKSQRIVTSHTGIMRYSQKIRIDRIGSDDDDKYSVHVNLLLPNDDTKVATTRTTAKKPFEALSVHVSLEQVGRNVHIYAAGLMKVNRKVIPNFVVFDASGLAGNMAGKGTLWLAAHFAERNNSNDRRAKVESQKPS